MTHDHFRELADRVKTEQPSRYLDALIWDAIGLSNDQEAHCATWTKTLSCDLPDADARKRLVYFLAWAPAYTSSIDAAASLAPSGWGYYLWHETDGTFEASGFTSGGHPPIHAAAPTGAQALTAVALRIRAAMADHTT